MSLLQRTFSEQPVASTSTLVRPVLSDAQIDRANEELADAEPQAILEWAVQNVPHLFQTTAFGLTGLAATDMLSKIFDKLSLPGQPPVHSVPLIFLDTLYHFPQTIALAEQVSRKYGADLKIFTPENVTSTAQFEAVHGKELWSRDEDSYDYLVKVRILYFMPRVADLHLGFSGRTSTKSLRRATSRCRPHWSPQVTRRCTRLAEGHRAGRDGSDQNQPAGELVVQPS